MAEFYVELSDSTKVSGSLIWCGVVEAESKEAAIDKAMAVIKPKITLIRRSAMKIVPSAWRWES